jgi:hypothetical protein
MWLAWRSASIRGGPDQWDTDVRTAVLTWLQQRASGEGHSSGAHWPDQWSAPKKRTKTVPFL